MNKIVIIAQQIAQGMGYLHHRGITHKDLKTKNIFLENGRAIITDFGLVNVARRLCANTRFGQEAVSISSLTERYVEGGYKLFGLAQNFARGCVKKSGQAQNLANSKKSTILLQSL